MISFRLSIPLLQHLNTPETDHYFYDNNRCEHIQMMVFNVSNIENKNDHIARKILAMKDISKQINKAKSSTR